MAMNAVSHKPGDIVKLGGIDFVVLDNNMAGSSAEPEALFILAVNSQGESRFGDSNNYAVSDLRDAVCDWLDKLADEGVDLDAIIPRTIDLLTLDGFKGYGTLEVKAAPLTLDVLSYIQKNIKDIKEIVSCPELDPDSVDTNPYAKDGEQAAQGKGVALLFKKDPRKLTIEIPLPFMQYPVQIHGLEMVVPCETRTAGAIIYYPLSLLIAPGIC